MAYDLGFLVNIGHHAGDVERFFKSQWASVLCFFKFCTWHCSHPEKLLSLHYWNPWNAPDVFTMLLGSVVMIRAGKQIKGIQRMILWKQVPKKFRRQETCKGVQCLLAPDPLVFSAAADSTLASSALGTDRNAAPCGIPSNIGCTRVLMYSSPAKFLYRSNRGRLRKTNPFCTPVCEWLHYLSDSLADLIW